MIDTDININFDLQLRQLLEAYFDGSATEMQIECLRSMARKATDGTPQLSEPSLIEDLETFSILDEYAEATLLTLEDSSPHDLESRLDSTISALAAHSHRKRTIWMRTVSVAASVAILLTVGIGFVSHQYSSSPSATDEKGQISDTSFFASAELPSFPELTLETENTTIEETNKINKENRISEVSPAHTSAIFASASSSRVKINNKGVMKNTGSHVAETQDQTPASNLNEQLAVNTVTERLESANASGVLSPQITLSSAVPDQLQTSSDAIGKDYQDPSMASTMRQVMESLNKVNAVFYEARKTASSLSEEMIYAAASPLRSI